eukprot:6858014-Prymnesium_polylepis.1
MTESTSAGWLSRSASKLREHGTGTPIDPRPVALCRPPRQGRHMAGAPVQLVQRRHRRRAIADAIHALGRAKLPRRDPRQQQLPEHLRRGRRRRQAVSRVARPRPPQRRLAL